MRMSNRETSGLIKFLMRRDWLAGSYAVTFPSFKNLILTDWRHFNFPVEIIIICSNNFEMKPRFTCLCYILALWVFLSWLVIKLLPEVTNQSSILLCVNFMTNLFFLFNHFLKIKMQPWILFIHRDWEGTNSFILIKNIRLYKTLNAVIPTFYFLL